MPAIALRPRSPTEIIDAAFQLLRAHYVPIVTLSVAAQLPVLALNIVLRWQSIDATKVPDAGSILMYAFGALLFLFFLLVAQFPVIVACSQLYLGQEVDLEAAIGRALHRIVPLVIVYIIAWVIISIGTILFVIPGIYLFCRLIPLRPTTVLEDGGPLESFERAWRLGGGHAWHNFVTMAIAWVVYIGVYLVGAAIVTGLGSAIPAMVDPTVNAVFLAAFQSLVYPLIVATWVVLYYDLRIRKEGFDVEMMQKGLDVRAPA